MVASSTVETLAVIAVGLAAVYGGAAELLAYVRARHRLERTTAVVVGLVDVGGPIRARSRSYAAHFRFTTRQGRVVESVSSVTTFPGPKVGRCEPEAMSPDTGPLVTRAAGVGPAVGPRSWL